MIRWILLKIDHLIHKVIPHPPCEKAHYVRGGAIFSGYPTTTSNTAGATTVRYTNFP